MKPFAMMRSPNDVAVKDPLVTPKPVQITRETVSTDSQPTFNLTFAIGTPMKELHDAIIRTTLQYTRGNRLRAAQLLQINPRTIRRRLGKKEGATPAPRAA